MQGAEAESRFAQMWTVRTVNSWRQSSAESSESQSLAVTIVSHFRQRLSSAVIGLGRPAVQPCSIADKAAGAAESCDKQNCREQELIGSLRLNFFPLFCKKTVYLSRFLIEHTKCDLAFSDLFFAGKELLDHRNLFRLQATPAAVAADIHLGQHYCNSHNITNTNHRHRS